jgi:hypothetical protein
MVVVGLPAFGERRLHCAGPVHLDQGVVDQREHPGELVDHGPQRIQGQDLGRGADAQHATRNRGQGGAHHGAAPVVRTRGRRRALSAQANGRQDQQRGEGSDRHQRHEPAPVALGWLGRRERRRLARQRIEQGRRRAEAAGRLLAHGASQRHGHAPRQILAHDAGLGPIAVQDPRDQLRLGRGPERQLASEAVVDRGAEGVDVRPGPGLLTGELLRRHERRRAHVAASPGQSARVLELSRHAEVEDTQRAVAALEQVGRLDVTMENTSGMHLIEGVGHSLEQRRDLFGVEPAILLDPTPQVPPLEVLHHDGQAAAGQLLEVVHLGDRGAGRRASWSSRESMPTATPGRSRARVAVPVQVFSR